MPPTPVNPVAASTMLDDFMQGVGIGNEFARRKTGNDRGVLSDRASSANTHVPHYSKSVVADYVTGVHPENLDRLNLAARAGVPVGRVIGDVTGFGTQSYTWNMHPLDITSTFGRNILTKVGATATVAQTGAWAAANMLGYGSGNWNPMNLSEGGRQPGYQALSPDENDPSKSTNPALDLLIYRGLLGRTGQILPYDQFVKERPEVSFEDYDNYREYMRSPGFLGLAKGTTDGLDGPEARIMGYRVTPMGVAATLGTLGLAALGVKARRIGT